MRRLSPSLRPLTGLAVVSALLAALSAAPNGPKRTILGVALSPAHFPYFSDADIDRFFAQAVQIGSHITSICEWQSLPPLNHIESIQTRAARRGLKFHLYISPISLSGGRRTPAIPPSVRGASFRDETVRQAYTQQCLTLASLKPDYLGLATEVNFLAQNPNELDAFATLARDTYAAIKAKHPFQAVTISFHWDVMRAHSQFDILSRFSQSIDIYSFTSYPDAFGYPVKIPNDYYALVRSALPTARLGFSEIGWCSAPRVANASKPSSLGGFRN